MKSDFRKFRLFCRLGIIVAILAVVAQVCCVLFVGGTLGAAIGVTLLIVIGAVAAVLECAAYTRWTPRRYKSNYQPLTNWKSRWRLGLARRSCTSRRSLSLLS